MPRCRAWGVAIVGLLLGVQMIGAGAGQGLVGFDGRARQLDEFTGKGKWVVVMLWASDCHICNEEAPALNEFHARHANDDAIMLGIGLDGWGGREAAGAFIERHGVTFDSLLVDPGEGTAMYTALTGRPWVGTPTFLVYRPDGVLAAQQVGAIETEVIEGFMARHSVPATN